MDTITVYETDHPVSSSILGPDGKPLSYVPRQPVGFDLRPREERERNGRGEVVTAESRSN